MPSRRRRISRTRHPLQSLFLFLVVGAAAYFGWQNKHLFTGGPTQLVSADQRNEVREQVIDRFQRNPDFTTVRAISWRPREQRYRLDIQLDDTCPNPRDICWEVAEFVTESTEVSTTVIAVDSTGRELGRAVQ